MTGAQIGKRWRRHPLRPALRAAHLPRQGGGVKPRFILRDEPFDLGLSKRERGAYSLPLAGRVGRGDASGRVGEMTGVLI